MTPDEVEEVLFGLEGEEPNYRIRRVDDERYSIFGETGSGRLLIMIGEKMGNGQFRVFGARDMDKDEKRKYRGG